MAQETLGLDVADSCSLSRGHAALPALHIHRSCLHRWNSRPLRRLLLCARRRPCQERAIRQLLPVATTRMLSTSGWKQSSSSGEPPSKSTKESKYMWIAVMAIAFALIPGAEGPDTLPSARVLQVGSTQSMEAPPFSFYGPAQSD